MKALVVYESSFSNTRHVADAIARGLARPMQVDVVPVSANLFVSPDVDLLVVGGPAHAFSMTRTCTRAEAVSRGAVPNEQVRLWTWLERLPLVSEAACVATFDTRVVQVRLLPGSTSHQAATVLERRGYRPVAPAKSFYVVSNAGMLLEGELERGRVWGEQLALAYRSSVASV